MWWGGGGGGGGTLSFEVFGPKWVKNEVFQVLWEISGLNPPDFLHEITEA